MKRCVGHSRTPLGTGTPSTELFQLLVFLLRLLHGLGLELLSAAIEPDEESPRRKEHRGRDADGGGIGQVFRGFLTVLEYDHEGLDRERYHEDYHEARKKT